MLQRMEAGKL